MVLKKPAALLSSYSHLPSLYYPAEIPCTSIPAHPSSSCSPLRPQRRRRSFRRYYATVHTDNPNPDANDSHLQWPTSSSTTAIPSPYQILHQNPRKAYSKHCFYKLVKVYHPDRNSCNQDTTHDHIRRLPGHIKMERYRLIVAANEILSDPAKRKAYDRYGAGWNGRLQEQVYTWRERTSTTPNGGSTTGETRWSGFDTNDSPFANATWEDWERWYKRHNRTKPEPLYTSNGGFLSLVALALVVGGIGQGMTVDRHQDLFSAQAEIRHRSAGRALSRHRETGRTRGDVDERIQGFLDARDEAGYGFGEGVEHKVEILGVGGDGGDGGETADMVRSDGGLPEQQQQQQPELQKKKKKRRKERRSSDTVDTVDTVDAVDA